MKIYLLTILGYGCFVASLMAQGKHSPSSRYPTYEGRVMGAYQGWFRAPDAGAKMFYVAMFDEMDEGTAIFKCSSNLPVGPKRCDYDGMPSDHYLWLTGRAGETLRGEVPFSNKLPVRGDQGQIKATQP